MIDIPSRQPQHCVANTVPGHSDGGVYGYIYPQNQSKSTFYGVKMTSEWLLNTNIEVLYPKKTLIPQNKFLATPLHCPPRR